MGPLPRRVRHVRLPQAPALALDALGAARADARGAVDLARSIARLGTARGVSAFERYLESIPETKRFDRALFYELHDVVGKSGFGIGSAGLPAYNVLVEGFSQALDNDVVLSMKQANVPAVSSVSVSTGRIR